MVFSFFFFFFKFQSQNTQIKLFSSEIQAFLSSRVITSRVLISNMTLFFLKFQAKNTQIKLSWFQIQAFSFFFVKFCNYTNSKVLISNVTISFSNCNPKNPKRQLRPQIYAFLFLQKILQLDKFEAFLVPKAILIPNFRHFIFSRSLTIMKIRVILIANMAMACFNSSLEIPK